MVLYCQMSCHNNVWYSHIVSLCLLIYRNKKDCILLFGIFCHMSCYNDGYSYKRMSWLLGLSVCFVGSFSLFLLLFLLLSLLSLFSLSKCISTSRDCVWFGWVSGWLLCCIYLQVVITNRWTTDRSHFCMLLFVIGAAGFCMHRNIIKLQHVCMHSYIE